MDYAKQNALDLILANSEIVAELTAVKDGITERIEFYEASTRRQRRLLESLDMPADDAPRSYVERAEDAGYDPGDPKAFSMYMRGDL